MVINYSKENQTGRSNIYVANVIRKKHLPTGDYESKAPFLITFLLFNKT